MKVTLLVEQTYENVVEIKEQPENSELTLRIETENTGDSKYIDLSEVKSINIEK